MDKMNSQIVANGRKNFRASKTYRDKVNAIKLDVETHYKNLLDKEQNFIKRIILKIKMRIAIGREIAKLNSLDKLHLKAKQI